MKNTQILTRLVLAFALVLSAQTSFAAVALDKKTVEFVPATGGETVKFSFEGRIFKKNQGILINEKTKDPIGSFIQKVIETNKAGDKQAILDTWAEADKPAIAERMENEAAFKNNQGFFINMRNSRLVGIIKYGDLYLTFIMHDIQGIGEYVKLYPVKEVGKELYLSNELQADFFYSRMVDSLSEYLWK